MAFDRRSTRASALSQLLLGGLCFVFGLADCTDDTPRIFTVELGLGIWCGFWIFVSGSIGIAASRSRHENTPKIVLIAVYMGFSVTSSILAIILVSCYGYAMSQILNKSRCFVDERFYLADSDSPLGRSPQPSEVQCKAKLTLISIIILFAGAEIGVSVWAAVCCFKAGKCCEPLNIYTVPEKCDQIVYRRMNHEEDMLLAAEDSETMV